MNGYAAAAHIDRVAPRLVIGRGPSRDVDAGGMPAVEVDESAADLAAVNDDDPLAERLASVSERWAQLTFFLFDPESWRR